MDNKKINDWLKNRKARKEQLNAKDLFDGIQNKDIQALSSAITLLESSKPDDRKVANNLIQMVLPKTGNSIRIGITGVPGVGKSTFIEAFGEVLLESKKKIAILAIDPSSSSTGGSILGDKTRMQNLSSNADVFIRPSPAGSTLGGVARKTRESIFLCEAAGYEIIIVETVGVGQSETMVHSMVDFFLLLMLAGAGDELQGIKRGIMEMADALVITKADGENKRKANLARQEYSNAMHLFPPKQSGWIPESLTCSSVEKENISKIWEVIKSFQNQMKLNGFYEKNRKEQDKFWLKETLQEQLLHGFYSNEELVKLMHSMEEAVLKGDKSSFSAAEELYHNYIIQLKNGRI